MSDKHSITQDYVKSLFDYHEDGHLIWKTRQSDIKGQIAGWIDGDYRRTTIDGRSYRVHRIVFLWHHGYFPQEVDHINRNTLDNRIENLRPATHTQNMHNRKKLRNNTSGFTGVFKVSDTRYRAIASLNGKLTHLGRYSTPEEASGAYQAFVEKHRPYYVKS